MKSLHSTAILAAMAVFCQASTASAQGGPYTAIPAPPRIDAGSYGGDWHGSWVTAGGRIYQGAGPGSYAGRNYDGRDYDSRNYEGERRGDWRHHRKAGWGEVDWSSADISARNDWQAECRSRLDSANHGRNGPEAYRGSCADWLNYYEDAGYTEQGYGFTYAIPVMLVPLPQPVRTTVTTLITTQRVERQMVPCRCAPRRRHVPDKRVRLIQGS